MADEVVGPDAQGNMALLRDGVVVQTWNSLDFLKGLGGQGAAPSGNTSRFDPQGNPLPPVQGIPATPEGVAQAAMPADPGYGSTDILGGGDDWYASPAPSPGAMRGGGGTRPVQTAPASAMGGDDWYTGGPPANYGGTLDPMGNIPNYQNGARHPAAGGAPLTPGGQWASQDGGPDTRKQMTQYDTGASAGPFGVQSPRADVPSHFAARAFDESGRAYADRGTHTSPMYDALRAKGDAMAGKVRGMADKIQGMGSGGAPPATAPDSYAQQQRQYDRTGKRIDKAYDRYNEALYNPDPLPVHGWSKRQGFKPGTIEAVLGDPTLLLNSAVPGYESKNSFGSNALEAMPMTDLAMMHFGAHGKGLSTKTPTVPVPHILAQQGVKPVKPDTKRVLDPSKVANKVAGMWRSLNEPGVSYGDLGWMDRDTLVHDLATADRKSILRQNLRTQFEDDPNAAMQSASSYLRSAFSTGPHTLGQDALIADVDHRITNMGDDLLRMKPKKASRVVNQLARSYY